METMYIPGWDPFFEELSRMLRSSNRQFGIANAQYSEYIIDRLELAVANVTNLQSFCRNQPSHDIEPLRNVLRMLTDLLHKMVELVEQWKVYADRIELEATSSCYMAPLQQSTGRRGRSRFSIEREQLVYLRSLRFSWVDISNLLGVSRMTVYRRRVEFDLVDDDATTDVDDGTLTGIIGEIRNDLPEIGESMIMGRLRSMGLHIPRQRVRESIRTADPLNVALRWHSVTSRQPYSVPGPNSLWHIGMISQVLYACYCMYI